MFSSDPSNNSFSSKLARREVPDVLYHYTSQKNLLSIVDSKELWATHSDYLNDKKELVYVFELIELRLKNIIKSNELTNSRGKPDLELLNEMKEYVGLKITLWGDQKREILWDSYLCSFSEEHDSLPQWTAYGGEGCGVAVGFRGSFLSDLTDFNGYMLIPCVYEEKEHQELVDEFINEQYNILKSLKESGHSGFMQSHYLFMNQLFWLTPLIKHKSFRYEKEWRIVFSTNSLNSMMRKTSETGREHSYDENMHDFRIGKFGITPFYRVNLFGYNSKAEKEAWSQKIENVVCGPTSDNKLAYMSLRRYCSVKMKGVGIANSGSPHR